MKKLLFILPLLYYSYTDDIVADINTLQTDNVEQDRLVNNFKYIGEYYPNQLNF